MGLDTIEAVEQRDRALQKLHDLTWACFMWAAGMVAVFSVIAAVTLPGTAQNAAAASPVTDSSNTSASTATTSTDDGEGGVQPPAVGSFQPSGGNPPVAVSGGSH
jgi:hypothetical protein